jgi:hypothetical protein
MRAALATIAPAWMSHCDIRLGEVRRRQGRHEDAVRLLQPLAAHPLALLPLAWLRLDADDPDGTLSLVERYVRRITGDQTRRLHALDLIVRAASLAKDDARAAAALEELRALVPKVNTRIALACRRGGSLTAAPSVQSFDLRTRSTIRPCRSLHEATAARLRLAGACHRRTERASREREAAKW